MSSRGIPYERVIKVKELLSFSEDDAQDTRTKELRLRCFQVDTREQAWNTKA